MADPRTSRTSGTGRVEAFSDAVFAIAMTLLVLDLRTPGPGAFVPSLLLEWPTYLAYLAAFLTIASIWMTHHALFTRLTGVDPPVLIANLMLLLGASLVPWPTALLSAAIGSGHYADEVAAITVYAVVSVIVSGAWTWITTLLLRRPALLAAPEDRGWLRRNRRYSLAAGTVAVISAALGFLVPLLALLIFLAVPLAFLVLALGAREAPVRTAAPDEP